MTTEKLTNNVRQGQTSGNMRYVVIGSMLLSALAVIGLMFAY